MRNTGLWGATVRGSSDRSLQLQMLAAQLTKKLGHTDDDINPALA